MNFLRMIGLDWYYLVLVVPAMILSIAASYMVKSRFATYDKIKSKKKHLRCDGGENLDAGKRN